MILRVNDLKTCNFKNDFLNILYTFQTRLIFMETQIVVEFYCKHAHLEIKKLEKTIKKKLNVVSGDSYNCTRYNYWIRRTVTNMTGLGGENKEDKDLLAKIVKTNLTYCVKEYKEWLNICKCVEYSVENLKLIFFEHLEDAKIGWNYRKQNICEYFIESFYQTDNC